MNSEITVFFLHKRKRFDNCQSIKLAGPIFLSSSLSPVYYNNPSFKFLGLDIRLKIKNHQKSIVTIVITCFPFFASLNLVPQHAVKNTALFFLSHCSVIVIVYISACHTVSGLS